MSVQEALKACNYYMKKYNLKWIDSRTLDIIKLVEQSSAKDFKNIIDKKLQGLQSQFDYAKTHQVNIKHKRALESIRIKIRTLNDIKKAIKK